MYAQGKGVLKWIHLHNRGGGGKGQNYGDFCVPIDPNLDCSCIQQLDAAPFCENYAKPYFDAKHFEREWNREW